MKNLLFLIIIIIFFKLEPAQIFDDHAPDGGKQEKEQHENNVDKYIIVKQHFNQFSSEKDSNKISNIIKQYEYPDEVYEKYLKEKKDKAVSKQQWDKNNEELILAVENDNELRVKELLDSAEVNVNVQNCNGVTALMKAVHNENLSIIQLLLNKGADINAHDIIGWTALTYSIFVSDINIFKFLFNQAGANINNKSIDGDSILMSLLRFGYYSEERVEFLLKKGIDVNARDNKGQTVLFIAIRSGNESLIKLLMNYGAAANKSEVDNALKERLDLNDNFRIRSLITSYQNYLEKINIIKSYLPKELATIVRDYYSFEHIEKNTVKLIDAVLANNQKEVKELLESGEVFINKQIGINRDTALMLAVQKREANLNIIELLLSHGADVNIQDICGKTAIKRVAEKHNIYESDSLIIIQILIRSGANISIKDIWGKHALDLAREKGNKKIVEYLENSMNISSSSGSIDSSSSSQSISQSASVNDYVNEEDNTILKCIKNNPKKTFSLLLLAIIAFKHHKQIINFLKKF